MSACRELWLHAVWSSYARERTVTIFASNSSWRAFLVCWNFSRSSCAATSASWGGRRCMSWRISACSMMSFSAIFASYCLRSSLISCRCASVRAAVVSACDCCALIFSIANSRALFIPAMTLFLTNQSAYTPSVQAAACSKDDYFIVLNLLRGQYKRADARRQDFCCSCCRAHGAVERSWLTLGHEIARMHEIMPRIYVYIYYSTTSAQKGYQWHDPLSLFRVGWFTGCLPP